MFARRRLLIMLFACAVAVLVTEGSGIVHASGPIGSVFRISYQSVDTVFPAAAYNPNRQEYLVVWSNDRPGNDDIQAQRVSEKGTLVGATFFVSTGPGVDRRVPDVAYDSQRNEYLVVWESSVDLCSIYAQRVSATGLLLEPHEIKVRDLGVVDRDCPAHPAVAYASTANKYLVVWDEIVNFTTMSSDIIGQMFSSAGAPEGGAFVIPHGSTESNREKPDLAYNRARNEFLVVWQQWNFHDFDIYARRVTGGGQLLQPQSIDISGAHWTEDQKAPAVAALPNEGPNGQYLVVWEDHNPGGIGHTTARRVEGTGSPSGSSCYVCSLDSYANDQTNPAVASNESAGQYLVSWIVKLPDPWRSLYIVNGRAIAGGGGLLGNNEGYRGYLGGGLRASRHVALAGGPPGDFLAAFSDLPSTTVDIFGAL